MVEQIKLLEYEEGVDLPVTLLEQAQELFRSEYFEYHYLHDLAGRERVKILAFHHEVLIGYASFKVIGEYAHSANLLVARNFRSKGIASILETRRFQMVRHRRKKMYVSCVCDDLASQKLKLKLELTPVNLKYGFRRRVLGWDHIGSALVFSEGNFFIVEPAAFCVITRQDLSRVRILSPNDPVSDNLATFEKEFYVEILVGHSTAKGMMNDSKYSYAGIDLDMDSGSWHHCFQVKNRCYYDGLEEQPKCIVNPSYFLSFLQM